MAVLATVQRQVYDLLAVGNPSSYGSLVANKRYLSEAIDDAIASADIATVKTLLANKQDSLLQGAYQSATGINSGDLVNTNWAIISVEYDSTGTPTHKRAIEIPYEEYEEISAGGIYDTATYEGYYAIKDSRVYMIASNDNIKLTYINLTHPSSLSTLSSPAGFESCLAWLACSILLTKRMDKPAEAEMHKQNYIQFMQTYLLPENKGQELVD